MAEYFEINLKNRHNFCAATACNEWIYYSAWEVNGLYRINIKSNEHEMLKVFDNKDNINGIHKLAFCVDKKIWFVPTNVCSGIAIYDTETKEIEYVSIPTSEHNCNKTVFESYHVVGDDVYLVPGGYDAILKVNLYTYEMERFSDWPVDINWDDKKLWFCDSVYVDNVIYICPCFAKCMVSFDTETGLMEKMCDCEENTYRSVISYKDSIIFFSLKWNSKTIEYNVKSKDRKCFEYKNMQEVDGKYRAMFVKNNIVWFFPLNGKQILKVNVEDKSISVIDIKTHNGNLEYIGTIKYADKFIVYSRSKGVPMVLIQNDNSLFVWDIENANNELDVFLNHVINRRQEVKNDEKMIGTQIYSKLIKVDN